MAEAISEQFSAESSDDISIVRRPVHVVRRYPIIPGLIILVLIIFAIFAPLIAPKDPEKKAEYQSIAGQLIGELGRSYPGSPLLSRAQEELGKIR